MNKNGRVYIAIEGCLAAGKTTLAMALGERLQGAGVVLEDFESNPFLVDFYENPRAYAFQSEMGFLLVRYHQLSRAARTIAATQPIVSDFLFDKSDVFAQLNLTAAEYSVFRRTYTYLQRQVPVPDLVLYLHAPVSVLLDRITQRGRPYEKGMDPKYIARLSAAYDRFFEHYTAARLILIDTTAEGVTTDVRHLDSVLKKL
jgi:deoxyguanosine kinase